MKHSIEKIRQTEKEDIFSFCDEFNEEQFIRFPRSMEFTISEVES